MRQEILDKIKEKAEDKYPDYSAPGTRPYGSNHERQIAFIDGAKQFYELIEEKEKEIERLKKALEHCKRLNPLSNEP